MSRLKDVGEAYLEKQRVKAAPPKKPCAKQPIHPPTDVSGLIALTQEYGPIAEYQFYPGRRWRLDLAYPQFKVALEVEGGAWVKGRHNRGSGFLKDIEKYNTLSSLGWTLYRCSPEEVRNLGILSWLLPHLTAAKKALHSD